MDHETSEVKRKPLLLRILAPARHKPRRPDDEIKRLYPKFRWQILEATFIGYATFYMVRNNLPVVAREMGDAMGYGNSEIGGCDRHCLRPRQVPHGGGV